MITSAINTWSPLSLTHDHFYHLCLITVIYTWSLVIYTWSLPSLTPDNPCHLHTIISFIYTFIFCYLHIITSFINTWQSLSLTHDRFFHLHLTTSVIYTWSLLTLTSVFHIVCTSTFRSALFSYVLILISLFNEWRACVFFLFFIWLISLFCIVLISNSRFI